MGQYFVLQPWGIFMMLLEHTSVFPPPPTRFRITPEGQLRRTPENNYRVTNG